MNIDSVAASYRARLHAWAELVYRDPAGAERVKVHIAALLDQLTETQRGRELVVSVMHDPSEDILVRVMAASHAVGWDPRLARRVLRELRDSGADGHEFAETVLIENFGEGL